MAHLCRFSSVLLFHRVQFLLSSNQLFCKPVWLPPSSSQLGSNLV